ncbi:MAG: nitrate reductase associated protein [Cyanophyceae cyanobacterium]
MSDFFRFEADFVDSLRCIPMVVRMKLDTCGVKLKLHHWNQLTSEERQTLVAMPCTTSAESEGYRDFLQHLVTQKTGAPAGELAVDSPWMDASTIPVNVQEKAAEYGAAVSLSQWAALTPLQRFALIKLSRPSHENANFLPALKEFQLV